MRKIAQGDVDLDDNKNVQQSWRWGELPSPPPESAHASHKNSVIKPSTSTPNDRKFYNKSVIKQFKLEKC